MINLDLSLLGNPSEYCIHPDNPSSLFSFSIPVITSITPPVGASTLKSPWTVFLSVGGSSGRSSATLIEIDQLTPITNCDYMCTLEKALLG